jgi:DNA recombination protein RmuC
MNNLSLLSNLPPSVIAGVSFSLGALLIYLIMLRKNMALRQENAIFSMRMDMAKENAAEQKEAVLDAQDQLIDSFAALSTHALKQNSEMFLRLSRESLRRHHQRAEAQLSHKEQSFAHLIEPIKETLEKTQQQIQTLETDRKMSFSALQNQLDTLNDSEHALRDETSNLVKALRRPEVRGEWGEMTLKRVAELAGMVEFCDFYQQESHQHDGKTIRPDMIVRLPQNRILIVDAKTPLDGYLSAIEAKTEDEQQNQLKRHAKNTRDRIKELSSKAYWQQFDQSPDFVVLFIPGEQFLSAALDQDRNLLEDAMKQRIILASPCSFMAILRSVNYSWKQLKLAENAEVIRALGEDMHKRLTTFTEHLEGMGKSLGQSVNAYNKAVGSLERQVLPCARKFGELGIQSLKETTELSTIEAEPRKVAEQEPCC